MKVFLSVFTAIIISTLSSAIFAADHHYIIFIDAGSTGSRLHIFQYENSASMPVINDVFSESVKPGLSSYADQPESAGASLKKILDDAAQFLQKNGADAHTVPLNIFATAGMRLLPQDKQQAIYANIDHYVKANYTFAVGEIKTISGKMEGLYGWLDVNYLARNFQDHQPTVGSIDMGGASTQIAFATQDQSRPDDEATVRINNQIYTVFSKSFLGLGQDQALNTMDTNPNASACYPPHYLFDKTDYGHFNFAACEIIYSNIIQNSQAAQQIMTTKGQSFVAYSAVYYAYNFLNVDKTPDEAIVDERIQSVCNEPWEQLQKDYPQVAEKYLSAYCANSVYLTQLLYSAYQLKGNQLTVSDKVNQKDIDWTLGAALFSLL